MSDEQNTTHDFDDGQREGYSEEQIDEYGLYIELAAKLYPAVAETQTAETKEAAA